MQSIASRVALCLAVTTLCLTASASAQTVHPVGGWPASAKEAQH